MTNWTRRVVLQRGLQLSALGVATPLAINLAAIGEAAAFDASDYKADWNDRVKAAKDRQETKSIHEAVEKTIYKLYKP